MQDSQEFQDKNESFETQDLHNSQDPVNQDKTEESKTDSEIAEGSDAQEIQLSSNEHKIEVKKETDLKKLRIGLVQFCVFGAVLIAALCLSLLGWKRSSDNVSALETLNSSLNALNSNISQAQSELTSEKNTISSLESRVNAAEQQNTALAKQLEDLNKELDRINKLKAERQPTAKPIPPASDPAKKAEVSKGEKLIALTFDDGPANSTERLLDELKTRGMKATFFVVGRNANKYPALLRRMVKEGHEIGNHSYSHCNLTKSSKKDVENELFNTSRVVQDACGTIPSLMRPPGGNYNKMVNSVAAGFGQRVIYWSVDTRDWESRNVNAIMTTAFRNGKYGIRDGAIVLMHDVYPTTVDAAIKIMNRLQKEDYRTVTVSELLNLRQSGGLPGEVFWCVV